MANRIFDRAALRDCFSGAVLRRSLAVAVVVGTVLNLINQGDVILTGSIPALWKVASTYAVPFLVASYGAYAALAVRGSDDDSG